MPRVILASSSPRRKHLLSMLGVVFETMPSEFDEYAAQPTDFPSRESYVETIAAGKVLEVSTRLEDTRDTVILGGDLTTFLGEIPFHKPKNYEQAHEYLLKFTNVWHDEIFATCVWSDGELRMVSEKARIFTPELSEIQMKTYLRIASPLDKAGGYSIAAIVKVLQNQPGLILEGSLSGVLGLPLEATAQLLRSVGVTVPAHEHDVEHLVRAETLGSI